MGSWIINAMHTVVAERLKIAKLLVFSLRNLSQSAHGLSMFLFASCDTALSPPFGRCLRSAISQYPWKATDSMALAFPLSWNGASVRQRIWQDNPKKIATSRRWPWCWWQEAGVFGLLILTISKLWWLSANQLKSLQKSLVHAIPVGHNRLLSFYKF